MSCHLYVGIVLFLRGNLIISQVGSQVSTGDPFTGIAPLMESYLLLEIKCAIKCQICCHGNYAVVYETYMNMTLFISNLKMALN